MSLTPATDYPILCCHCILYFAFVIPMTIIMIICVLKKSHISPTPLQLVLGVK